MSQNAQINAERAGLGGDLRMTFSLGVPNRRFIPSAVKLEDASGEAAIEWRLEDITRPEGKWREVTSDQGLLSAFIALADEKAPAVRFLRFAQKHGVLYLCEHGEPLNSLSRVLPVCGVPHCPVVQREPLAVWREYARHAEALIAVAADLHTGRQPGGEKWESVCRWIDWSGGVPTMPRLPENDRWVVTRAIGKWAGLGNLHYVFSWEDAEPRIEPRGSHLFGAIAREIVAAISRVGTLVLCSECGATFRRATRRPQTGRRAFCRWCKDDGAPERWANREYRARKRAAASA